MMTTCCWPDPRNRPVESQRFQIWSAWWGHGSCLAVGYAHVGCEGGGWWTETGNEKLHLGATNPPETYDGLPGFWNSGLSCLYHTVVQILAAEGASGGGRQYNMLSQKLRQSGKQYLLVSTRNSSKKSRRTW